MSPNVGNFVSDLVEMAKATEQLPRVQEELDRANTQVEELAKALQSRELHIIDLKNQIDDLNAKLRAMEVSRDDAEYRFLEADDRTDKALAFVRMVQENAGSLLAALTPPKPEPEAGNVDQSHSTQALSGSSTSALPEPSTSGGLSGDQSEMQSTQTGQSEVPPISVTTPGNTETPAVSPAPDQASASSPSWAEPETPPTPFALSSSSDPSPIAGEVAGTSADASSTTTSTSDKPYIGKKWSEVVPRVWAKEEWIAGGGTEESWAA